MWSKLQMTHEQIRPLSIQFSINPIYKLFSFSLLSMGLNSFLSSHKYK